MNKKIIFQKCNFNTIYFLLYIIFGIIDNIIKYNNHPNFWNKSRDDSENKISLSYRLLLLYTSNISDFLAFIPYLIHKKLSRENRNIDKVESLNINSRSIESKESDKLIYNSGEPMKNKKRKKYIIIYFIIIAFLDFLNYFIKCLYIIIFQKELFINDFNSITPLNIIFQFVSSYLILKIYFYKLQYFSLILNIIVFIIILIFDLIIIFYYSKFDGYAYIFFSFSLFFLSVEYSLGKKVILYGFISIYFLFMMRGLIKLALTAILTVIYFYTNKTHLINLSIWLRSIDLILLNISNIIVTFFEGILLWIIIDRFSPNYIPLALIFKEISDYIVIIIIITKDIIDSNVMGWDIYVRIFLYLILIIGVMIHNEIIIINICGLASDTKYFLDLKVEIEQLYSDTDEPEILKRFETIDEMDDKNNDANISTKNEISIKN